MAPRHNKKPVTAPLHIIVKLIHPSLLSFKVEIKNYHTSIIEDVKIDEVGKSIFS